MTPPGSAAFWRRLAPMAVLVLLAVWPADAEAQTWHGSDAPRRGSVEISGGLVYFGGFDTGSLSAEETRNINMGVGPFTLFATHSRVGAAPGAQLRVGVYLSKAISIEAGLQYARPKLSSTVTGDAEGAPGLTAEDATTRYLADGSLVLHLTRLSFGGGRGVPFLSGGGGYLRELHEQNKYIETGREIHALAGLNFWFGRTPRVGLRVDAGASIRDGGVDFRRGRRTVPTAGLSLAYLF